MGILSIAISAALVMALSCLFLNVRGATFRELVIGAFLTSLAAMVPFYLLLLTTKPDVPWFLTTPQIQESGRRSLSTVLEIRGKGIEFFRPKREEA